MRTANFSPAQQEIIDVIGCLDENEDLTELKYTLVKFLNERLQKILMFFGMKDI